MKDLPALAASRHGRLIAPGTRLGAYEVLGLLGAGGMGEVYRARDTRLQRDIAIKVLPDLFANDHERMARFSEPRGLPKISKKFAHRTG